MTGRVLALLLLCLLSVSRPAWAEVKVEVDGLGSEERGNVIARLAIHQQAERKDLDQALVERLNEQAPANIREALQPYGYYTPSIESELKGKAPNWTVRYRIDAGPTTHLAKVDIQLSGEGAGHDAFKVALRRAERRLTVGERLKHGDYEEAKKLIADAAYAGGFLDAHWETSELRVNPDSRSAEVVLHMDTGVRYAFGQSTLIQDGEQKLEDDFIDRYVTLRDGDPFDPQKVLDQQFALSELGYFQSVEITPRRDEVDEQHRVPLVIHTTPRKKHRYETGVGYGTDTGARLSVGTDWRQINQYGHNLDLDARLSQIRNTAAANYRIPRGHEPGENWTLTASRDDQQLRDGDTIKNLVGVSLNKKPGKWLRRLYLEYTHERTNIGDTRNADVTADLLTPGISFTRTEADDPIFSRRGWYVFADVHGAQENALSDTTFVRTYLNTRGVYALGWRTRLLARVELGANFHDEFAALPASQRFFAGGDQSVRGYSYQSIGRRDADGNVIGGQYLATFSLEVEQRIHDKWGAAVFVDSGGADDVWLPKQYIGAGAGVRYRAPVGSFQLDLAHPFTGDTEGQFAGVRLHIGVRVGF